jgi:DNA repair exonuclease SbcCD ATPase subunit
LDAFFPDESITVTLKTFKQVKNNSKPQINVEIYYKNSECDISELSKGEYSRVNLAFTLALNEMFNCPLLMLDEITAGLDAESTETVFDSIKSTYTGKIVLVVQHQVTAGIFDKTITL